MTRAETPTQQEALEQLAERVPEEVFCQHIGPLQIGTRFSETTESLGKPQRRMVDSDSQKVYVYGLAPATDNPEIYPYLVVGGVRDTVTLLQITGSPVDPRYGFEFSTIELGDSEAQVLERLGAPRNRQRVSGLPGTSLWSYEPYPISLELKSGTVRSIRIWTVL